MFNYDAPLAQYGNGQFPMNLGMISSTAGSDDFRNVWFDTYVDIAKYLENPELLNTSNENTRKRRKRSTANVNKAAITRFTVPQQTQCYVSITTEFGTITMDLVYGKLVSWNHHTSANNISQSTDNVFVVYRESVNMVTFRCSCKETDYACGGE